MHGKDAQQLASRWSRSSRRRGVPDVVSFPLPESQTFTSHRRAAGPRGSCSLDGCARRTAHPHLSRVSSRSLANHPTKRTRGRDVMLPSPLCVCATLPLLIHPRRLLRGLFCDTTRDKVALRVPAHPPVLRPAVVEPSPPSRLLTSPPP